MQGGSPKGVWVRGARAAVVVCLCGSRKKRVCREKNKQWKNNKSRKEATESKGRKTDIGAVIDVEGEEDLGFWFRFLLMTSANLSACLIISLITWRKVWVSEIYVLFYPKSVSKSCNSSRKNIQNFENENKKNLVEFDHLWKEKKKSAIVCDTSKTPTEGGLFWILLHWPVVVVGSPVPIQRNWKQAKGAVLKE